MAGEGDTFMSVGPRRLVQLAEQVYAAFDPAKFSLDAHIDNHLTSLCLPSTDDEIFIQQVVYGVVRHTSLLTSLLDAFFHYNG